MRIVLMMVVSVNGKITRGNDPDVRQWTSQEDQRLFASTKELFGVIIMGSHTYETNVAGISLSDKTKRIVLTTNPDAYADRAVPGKLEFSDETPIALINRLKSEKHTNILVLGGSQIASSFFRDQLIDELRLTIEPKLFGSGVNFLSDLPVDVQLQLKSVRELNKQGTIHMTYTVRRTS